MTIEIKQLVVEHLMSSFNTAERRAVRPCFNPRMV